MSTAFRFAARSLRCWWAAAPPRVHLSVLAAIALLVAVHLYAVLDEHLLIDLQVYRFGVEAWWHGGDVYGRMPATSAGNKLPYLYPPPSLLLFAPLAAMPLSWAILGATAVSVLALAVTVYFVIGRCWPRGSRADVLGATALVMPFALLLEPVRETLVFGQVNLWLMALVAADTLARRPRWPRGLLVGLAFALKLTPAAFVLFFLLRRDMRAVVVTAVSAAGFALLGFVLAWKESVAYWLTGAGPTDGVSGSPYATNQTVTAALTRLELPEVLRSGLWLVLVGCLFVVAVRVMARVDAPTAVVVNAALALLVSPTAWSHHWVWIVPALIVFCFHAVHRRQSVLVAVLVFGVFLVGPHQDLPRGGHQELRWTWYEHVYGNAYLLLAIAGLLFTAWRLRSRRPLPDREMVPLPDREPELV